ncbi:odorant receptor 46a-like isoform X2 [Trichoplusia ni]|uniref:Odorant receptor n=1 Tax=Trichoplusia ni TaxID=7111 RepID=A0A7E5WKN6_TRINI|nr:odorant receptor 46a-like isoform X2 [Trichoplusia ni]
MKSPRIDMYRHISIQIGALKFFGIWFYIPYSKKNVWFWINILTRIVLGIAVFVIPTSAQLVYLIRLIVSGNAEIQEVAGIMNLVLTELLASLRLLDLRLRRDLLTKLSDELMSEEFQTEHKPQRKILEKAIVLSRRLFIVLLSLSGMDILVHVVLVPALKNFETLPLKMDFIFFDVNDEKYFDFICAYQILYKPMMLTTFVALQTLPWAAMSCAISQLDVLIYNFENMKEFVKATAAERNCGENEAFKEIFKRYVLHHRAILRFVSSIQAAFSGQLSSTLFISAGIVGTTGVQVFSIESPLKNFTEVIWVLAYFVTITCNLFIDCYFGNTVTGKSLHVATVVYSCPWIELPTHLKKNLVLFIAKTQVPLVITASKLVPVSLETFTKIALRTNDKRSNN